MMPSPCTAVYYAMTWYQVHVWPLDILYCWYYGHDTESLQSHLIDSALTGYQVCSHAWSLLGAVSKLVIIFCLDKYDTLLGQHLTAPVRRNTCVHCAIYHLLLSQDDLMGKHSCSLETFAGEQPIRDLNTEYRACSMATLSWAELSQVWL